MINKILKLIFIVMGGVMNLNAANGNIKAIIFDCDGTLVDNEHAHLISWQFALEKHGGELPADEYPVYVGKSAEVKVKILAEKLGKDCAEEILRDKRAYYHKLQSAGLPPIQPTIDFLHLLVKEKERLGLKLGLASAAKKNDILIIPKP